jgi:uncharacterized protein (TIGR00251 family)
MSSPAPPWQCTTDALIVSVRLTPKGGRDAIEGIAEMADGRTVLKVRVRAPASEGQANRSLAALLANTLGVARGDISVIAGMNARLKRLKVNGAAAAHAAALARICGAQHQGPP